MIVAHQSARPDSLFGTPAYAPLQAYKSTNDRSSETKIEPERSTRFEKKKNMPRQCWGHDVVPLRADTTVVVGGIL